MYELPGYRYRLISKSVHYQAQKKTPAYAGVLSLRVTRELFGPGRVAYIL